MIKNRDLANNPIAKEIYDRRPTLYYIFKSADVITSSLESLKLDENNWNPAVKPYEPTFSFLDPKTNAVACGLYNGLIDLAKSIPEIASFITTLMGSEKAVQEFYDGIKKLFTDEETQKAFLESIIKDYKESFEEGNLEKLYYHLAHDALSIIGTFIGIYGFFKGVANFFNFVYKALKRYGRKSIAKLKKLNKKQLKEVFDDLDEKKPIRLNLKTKKMKSKYLGEDKVDPLKDFDVWSWPHSVKYLDEFKRLKYKVKFKDGKIIDADGKLIDTSGAGLIDEPSGKAIFVMDSKGNIYLSNTHSHKLFHHSSLVSGEPVSAAGEIKVVKGVIKEINISSGHYEPTLELNKQMIPILEGYNINTKKINFTDEK